MSPDQREQWKQFGALLAKFEIQHSQVANTFAFSFVEGKVPALTMNPISYVGPLVKAIVNGHWVLLDEINLASAETLEVCSPLYQINL